MDYTIDKDSDNRRINVKVTCILDQKIRKKILEEVVNVLNISGYQLVQLDLSESTFKNDEQMIGSLELTTHMKEIGICSQTKFAFIYS